MAELFQRIGSPVELDELVNLVATLLDVKDLPVESIDENTLAYVEARIVDSILSSSSRLEEQALLRGLWQAMRGVVL